ncbi:MAG: hypothetical protein R3D58_13230 [Saprospiraceae bacterium]
MRNNIVQKIKLILLLVLAAASTSWGQVTKVDATRLLRPSGSNSRLLVTNSSGATAWTDAENFLSGSTGISISGNTIGLALGGTTGNIQFNNSTALGGSANLNWDNAALELQIGQPPAATGRIIVKGSSNNNTTYALQAFDNGDTERSRITNGGYFQGTGIGRIGFDYGAAFTLDARLYQPTSVSSAATSGSTSLASFSGGFAPTSGNAVMNLMEVVGTINQTGGANGKTRMLYLAANAISAANMYGLETVGGYNLIGNGTVPAEVMPRLAVVGLGNTSGTNAFCVYNTSSQIGLAVHDDGNVGIGTAQPLYKLDISGGGAVRIPRGTTAQRPSADDGVFRFNTTDDKFEGYDGTDWVQFGSGGGGSAYTEEITPAQITADQNNYNPTGLSTAAVIRLSTDGTFRKITGLAGGASKRAITLLNVGSYTVLLKNESTSSSAGNRFSFDGDDVFIFPGDGVQLYYDNTTSRWRCLSRPGLSSRPEFVTLVYWRHGVNGSTGSGGADFYSKSNSGGSGSGIGSNPFASTGISTSSSSTGGGSIGSPGTFVRASDNTYLLCRHSIHISDPSDETDTYTIRVGWMNSNNITEPSNGVYFRYTHSENSGNYQFVARSSSTETVINTGVAPTTSSGSPQSLKVVIDPSGNAAEGFIDGVSIGTVTTNIPTSTNLGQYIHIAKSAGTASRSVNISGAGFLIVTNIPK